ncbi:MAG: NADH:ubiquinone oxidoreductase [Desulfobacterales bacterium]|nr:NADH:ubiquinone oxidoreductase [Desulfobacterales bacterium]MBF0397067.1 NADH:ubiquinone oxidoreductase [Desulfobacterales bacterium]
MSNSLYWMQCGSCGGDSMSFLNSESPDIIELIETFNINLLWHPSLAYITHEQHTQVVKKIISGEQSLDILCIEGAIIRGPSGTGVYDTSISEPKKDLVIKLANQAKYVLAVGTCASYGGVCSAGGVEGTGLQFHKKNNGGFLGDSFLSKGGYPVINLPGCPCHGEIIVRTIMALISDSKILLTEFNAPINWYGILVHQGCTRNEYHEYQVEDKVFGDKGCLFFHLGCHGPIAYGSCNKLLWNRYGSKTRIGIPCLGCTMPDFPQPYPFFSTRNIEGIPLSLPDGIDRAHYIAYKGIAAATAPKRLKERKTNI